MIIEMLTHVAGGDGVSCADCGSLLAPLTADGPRWAPGAQIGRVVTEYGGARSYAIGEVDTNPPCTEALPNP